MPATHGDAERLENCPIEPPAGVQTRNHQLNVVNQTTAMELLGHDDVSFGQ
jgi:hypothetical protein